MSQSEDALLFQGCYWIQCFPEDYCPGAPANVFCLKTVVTGGAWIFMMNWNMYCDKGSQYEFLICVGDHISRLIIFNWFHVCCPILPHCSCELTPSLEQKVENLTFFLFNLFYPWIKHTSYLIQRFQIRNIATSLSRTLLHLAPLPDIFHPAIIKSAFLWFSIEPFVMSYESFVNLLLKRSETCLRSLFNTV